jgi:hypothetical protein
VRFATRVRTWRSFMRAITSISLSRKPFGIGHICIYTYFCLEWPILWPPRILTFPPGTSCIPLCSLIHDTEHIRGLKLAVVKPNDCCSDFAYKLSKMTEPPSICILTHSWSWALLEKLPVVHVLKNFPEFYGTRRFITVFTRALHWSLSSARSIQFIPSHPI